MDTIYRDRIETARAVTTWLVIWTEGRVYAMYDRPQPHAECFPAELEAHARAAVLSAEGRGVQVLPITRRYDAAGHEMHGLEGVDVLHGDMLAASTATHVRWYGPCVGANAEARTLTIESSYTGNRRTFPRADTGRVGGAREAMRRASARANAVLDEDAEVNASAPIDPGTPSIPLGLPSVDQLLAEGRGLFGPGESR